MNLIEDIQNPNQELKMGSIHEVSDSIPMGCRFYPTDEELVGDYLFKKLNGGLSPLQKLMVTDCDLYGSREPWELWDQFSANRLLTYGDLYFFTELKKKKATGSNFLRSIGTGKWHGEDTGTSVKTKVITMADGDGAKEMLVKAKKKRFNYREKNSTKQSCWIMIEFSLTNFTTNWVLCQLRKNGDNGDKGKRKIVSSEVVSFEKRFKANTFQEQEFDSNGSGSYIVGAEEENKFFSHNDHQTGFDSVANADDGFSIFHSNWVCNQLAEQSNEFLGCVHDLTTYDLVAIADDQFKGDIYGEQETGSDGVCPVSAASGGELLGYRDDYGLMANSGDKNIAISATSDVDLGISVDEDGLSVDDLLYEAQFSISMDDLFPDTA